jgi:hypothetical protein
MNIVEARPMMCRGIDLKVSADGCLQIDHRCGEPRLIVHSANDGVSLYAGFGFCRQYPSFVLRDFSNCVSVTFGSGS